MKLISLVSANRLDPALWSMINLSHTVKPSDRTSIPSHIVESYVTSIACVLLFITNNQCNSPLHVLLTDVLANHISTQEKIKILNQLGAIASVDTHAR